MQFTTLFALALASLTVAQEEPLATLYPAYGFKGRELVITKADTCIDIKCTRGFQDGMRSIKLNHAFCFTFKDAKCTEFFGQGYDTNRTTIDNGAGQLAIKCLPYPN